MRSRFLFLHFDSSFLFMAEKYAFLRMYHSFGGFSSGSSVKSLPTVQKPQQTLRVQPLGQEDPLEEGVATPSSILAWRIPWTEEPGGLQSMVSQSQTQLKRLSTCTQYQEKSDIFWYLVMAVTCLGMTVKSIYQSSPGCVPLV